MKKILIPVLLIFCSCSQMRKITKDQIKEHVEYQVIVTEIVTQNDSTNVFMAKSLETGEIKKYWYIPGMTANPGDTLPVSRNWTKNWITK